MTKTKKNIKQYKYHMQMLQLIVVKTQDRMVSAMLQVTHEHLDKSAQIKRHFSFSFSFRQIFLNNTHE